jgi:hypothetical protein
MIRKGGVTAAHNGEAAQLRQVLSMDVARCGEELAFAFDR